MPRKVRNNNQTNLKRLSETRPRPLKRVLILLEILTEISINKSHFLMTVSCTTLVNYFYTKKTRSYYK